MNLSSPFASGGGGEHFEAHVQALFVVLMLTGGYVPCLPCWPIAELRLQGRIDGFDTDDVIVIVEENQTRERRKLLGQVKYPISIRPGNPVFGKVIQAAWNDFNDPEVFSRGKDIIALMTGPLSGVDQRNVQWLLNQARHTKTVDEFLRNVKQAHFSPSKSYDKLEVFRHHLRLANGGQGVSEDDLYSFLNHFYILSYDLGNEDGVVLSLMYSHMSQFQQQYPQQLWSRVVDIVQTWNQDGGTITLENLPEDVIDAFKQRRLDQIPGKFTITQEVKRTDWVQHPDVTYLALANLVGGWKENNDADIAVTREMLGIE